jgi:hypothetical protein
VLAREARIRQHMLNGSFERNNIQREDIAHADYVFLTIGRMLGIEDPEDWGDRELREEISCQVSNALGIIDRIKETETTLRAENESIAGKAKDLEIMLDGLSGLLQKTSKICGGPPNPIRSRVPDIVSKKLKEHHEALDKIRGQLGADATQGPDDLVEAIEVLQDEVESWKERSREAEAQASDPNHPSKVAFDDIAKIVNAPDWEYPGQVVRDVDQFVNELFTAKEEVEKAKDSWRKQAELAEARNKILQEAYDKINAQNASWKIALELMAALLPEGADRIEDEPLQETALRSFDSRESDIECLDLEVEELKAEVSQLKEKSFSKIDFQAKEFELAKNVSVALGSSVIMSPEGCVGAVERLKAEAENKGKLSVKTGDSRSIQIKSGWQKAVEAIAEQLGLKFGDQLFPGNTKAVIVEEIRKMQDNQKALVEETATGTCDLCKCDLFDGRKRCGDCPPPGSEGVL